MVKKIGILLCVMMLATTPVFAHVMTETDLFGDLSISDAPEEITLLAALGIISLQDTERTFRPQDTLIAEDLAAWLGSYYGLEGTTSTELAQAAFAQGLLSTIDGNATYSLVDEAFFHGALRVENPDEEMTRDQFAKFMVAHIHTKIDGHTLMEKAGFTPGPTGAIEKVERVKKRTTVGEIANTYELTIDGQVHELGMHPRTIADTADPLVWKGLNVAASWYGSNSQTDTVGKHQHDENSGNHSNKEQQVERQEDTVASIALQFIVIGDTSVTMQVQNEAAKQVVEESNQNETTDELDEQLSSIIPPQESIEEVSASSTNILGFVGIGIVVIGGLLAFGMHRRRTSMNR